VSAQSPSHCYDYLTEMVCSNFPFRDTQRAARAGAQYSARRRDAGVPRDAGCARARVRPRLVVCEAREGNGYSASKTFSMAADFTITITITIRRKRLAERGKIVSASTGLFRVAPNGKIIQKP